MDYQFLSVEDKIRILEIKIRDMEAMIYDRSLELKGNQDMSDIQIEQEEGIISMKIKYDFLVNEYSLLNIPSNTI